MTTPNTYRGEVVYMFAFDVAYGIKREPIGSLLGHPVEQFVVDASKRNPRRLFFYRPQVVRLPAVERQGPRGPVRMERSVKLLQVGALSITVRLPFEVANIRELVEFHDLEFADGSALLNEVTQLASNVCSELGAHLIKPLPTLAAEEAYTVFCIASPLVGPDGACLNAETWLHANRRDVAALLTQETDPEHLSRQESDESTSLHLSYYDHDIAVIDWDAALLMDVPANFDEALYIMELANLQLAELEAYDRILDDSLESAYRDMLIRPIRSRRGVLGQLREIRIDLARLSDELSNITKFFGDWHLARIYQHLSTRFHLGDWHRTIDEKLKTLDDLYELLNQDRMNRWMLTLEITIVLLFVIDLIMLFFSMRGH
ncbi:MAG TPA: hypothetical protein VG733_01455 [Chthoniobacteraceae bacterium]|nr:hypothetical protein [Chthoniobacteraceae bacterium]